MLYTIRVRKLTDTELESTDGPDVFNPWELHCPEIPFTHYARSRESAVNHARGIVYIAAGHRDVPPESISFRVVEG